MRVLGVDPGVTTGIALFDTDEGRFTYVDEKTVLTVAPKKYRIYNSDLADWFVTAQITHGPFDIIVVENYIQRPFQKTTEVGRQVKFNQNLWIDQTTAKIIGMFTMYSILHAVPFYEQEPSIKPVGYGVLGNKYQQGKKGTHILDAMAHAAYWCHRHGVYWKGKHGTSNSHERGMGSSSSV